MKGYYHSYWQPCYRKKGSSVSRLRRALPSYALAALILAAFSGQPAGGAINWDAEAGTHWWFNPVNWNVNSNANNLLPPNGGSAFDTAINANSSQFADGVVFAPAEDPHFAAAQSMTYPADRGPQIIDQLYISRNTTNHNLLTIRGDLTSMAIVIVGRSGSTLEDQNLGRINQESGKVAINSNNLDIAHREGSGWGNGIYDYRGGSLEVSLNNGAGSRLSPGSSSNGTGGVGRFIMHNPATPGYVRTFNLNVAAHAGIAGNPALSANGVTNGVGIVEFHYENGGTRPLQISNDLIINNGTVANGTRSARLDLVLDSPVATKPGGEPIDLALFDVDFDHDPINSDIFIGSITGDGDLGDFFSSADGSTLYTEGSTVSASFGNVTYNWSITYTGNITWDDANAGDIGTITGPETGKDVVLIGLSTIANDADFDNDNFVGGSDFLIWQRGLGVGTTNATGDANNSGTVDGADFNIWKAGFGGPAAAGASRQIPEPGGLAIVAGTFAALAGGYRRQRRTGRRFCPPEGPTFAGVSIKDNHDCA